MTTAIKQGRLTPIFQRRLALPRKWSICLLQARDVNFRPLFPCSRSRQSTIKIVRETKGQVIRRN